MSSFYPRPEIRQSAQDVYNECRKEIPDSNLYRAYLEDFNGDSAVIAISEEIWDWGTKELLSH